MSTPTLKHLTLDDQETEAHCAALAVWGDLVARAGMRLFLALDAVWAEDLAADVRANCDQWEPLEGEPALPRTDAHPRAPILIDVTAHPEVIRPWVQHHFLARIGVIFASNLSLSDLRTSLKRFGLVSVEGAQDTVVFRYFDAEVLDAFLRVSHDLQRVDFFKNINGVILPDIQGAAWQCYRVREGALIGGILTGDTVDWTDIPPMVDGPDDQIAYEISFPFRTLLARQVQEMELACRRAFHREATRFLTLAFPEHCKAITQKDLMELCEEAEDTARQNKATEDSAAFLWIVLSFMAGLDFHTEDPVKTLLAMPGKDMESKLEDLVFDIGSITANIHLVDLCDTIEVWAETESGARSGVLHRSGRVLSDISAKWTV